MGVVSTLKNPKDNILNNEKDKKEPMASLIPNIDRLIDMQYNVLLYGKHGVGKTQALMEAAEKKGKTVKYYSCSTLDPFTDLVGIPYPDKEGTKLQMIRPTDINEAEIVFFDELNRAQDSKTLNAILEIVQFGSINGEKLPHLEACWAAVNPPEEDDYQVHDLDPALVDRFDFFFEITPKVSVPYLSQHMDAKIAQALQDWWKDRENKKENYISPRRIEKIGRAVQLSQDATVAKKMLPPGGNYDSQKLIINLNIALGKVSADDVVGIASQNIIYQKKFFKDNQQKVVDIINSNNVSEETLKRVCDVVKSGVSPKKLIDEHHKILEALPSSKLEGIYADWSASKRTLFINEINTTTNNIPNLRKFVQTHGVYWK